MIACLTLGLAPFSPEPHILGKLRWVLGGGDGMAIMDVADLLFHGSPYLWLLLELGLRLRSPDSVAGRRAADQGDN